MWSVSLLVTYLTLNTALGDLCRLDWEYFGERCYGFGELTVSWSDAAEYCDAAGAKLVEIETSAENDFLKGRAMNKSADNYWIGGTDVFHEGTWMWISTGELITFTAWQTGQPDDGAGHEDCLEMRKAFNYQWNDWVCDNAANFICETRALEEPVVG